MNPFAIPSEHEDHAARFTRDNFLEYCVIDINGSVR